MNSYMLLPDEQEMVGVRTVDSRVPMAYPRVGGVGNIGKDMDSVDPVESDSNNFAKTPATK